MRAAQISTQTFDQIRTALTRGDSIRAICLATGLPRGAIHRTAVQIVDRTRQQKEFADNTAIVAPARTQPLSGGWTLDEIRAARDDQMRGNFARPVRLAEAMRTDDALFTAYHARIAPQSACNTRLVPAGGVRGEGITRKAGNSCQVSRATLAGICGTMANHGIAVGYADREIDDDGERVDMKLREWPLEHVRFNHSTEGLETTTREGPRVSIVHGDGRWIVFKKFDVMPWTQDAALLAGALLWAGHAYGAADWAAASRSIGQAKVLGTLPQGVSLQESDGAGGYRLTAEARAYLQVLHDLVSGEALAGIGPFGAAANYLANNSTAWQVFSELMQDKNKGAQRVYTGTDAALGSVGGAPGVDIATLFGVATTRVQGDFDAIEQGLNTGFYQVWTAINFGDSHLAPRFEYLLPDPDAAAKSAERGGAYDRLWAALAKMRENQMAVDQSVVGRLCREFGIETAPELASAETASSVTIQLAPTDIAKVVRVSEARKSQGLQPFGDERDNLTITELDERNKAKAGAAQTIAEDQGTTPGATAAPPLLDAPKPEAPAAAAE
jgi:hypothetical protein